MNKNVESPAASSDSTKWADRLAKARAQRLSLKEKKGAADKVSEKRFETKIGETTRSVENQPGDGEQDIVSVDEVLQTANLNDRMEMARQRHVQILALRGATTTKTPDVSNKLAPQKHKNTFRAAIGKKPSGPKAPIVTSTPQGGVEDALNQRGTIATSEKKKRPPILLLMTGGVIALLLAVSLTGIWRNSATATLGNVDGNDDPAPRTAEVSSGASNTDLETISSNISTVTAVPVVSTSLQPIADTDTIISVSLLPSDLAPPTVTKLKNSRILQPDMETAPAELIELSVPEYVSRQTQPTILPNEQNTVGTVAKASLGDTPFVSGSFDLEATAKVNLSVAVNAVPENAILTAKIALFTAQRIEKAKRNDFPLSSAETELPRIVGVNIVVATPAEVNDLTITNSIDYAYFADRFFIKDIPAPNILSVPQADFVFASLQSLPSQKQTENSRLTISNLQIHSPSSLSDETLSGVIAVFKEYGLSVQASRKVNFNISKTNVRYFHPEDKAAAELVSNAIGGIARDFTDFRPVPPLGTVEVWLEGSSTSRPTARRQGAGSPPASRSTPREDPALIQLRNRLVESLKRGDHL